MFQGAPVPFMELFYKQRCSIKCGAPYCPGPSGVPQMICLQCLDRATVFDTVLVDHVACITLQMQGAKGWVLLKLINLYLGYAAYGWIFFFSQRPHLHILKNVPWQTFEMLIGLLKKVVLGGGVGCGSEKVPSRYCFVSLLRTGQKIRSLAFS